MIYMLSCLRAEPLKAMRVVKASLDHAHSLTEAQANALATLLWGAF